MSTIQLYEDTLRERCQKALERIRLARKAKVDAWVVKINTERSKPCIWNLWLPPEETEDVEVLKDWQSKNDPMQCDEDCWFVHGAFSLHEDRLKTILAAVSLKSFGSCQRLATLSLEDAALINKWNKD